MDNPSRTSAPTPVTTPSTSMFVPTTPAASATPTQLPPPPVQNTPSVMPSPPPTPPTPAKDTKTNAFLKIGMHGLLYISVFLAGFVAAKLHTLLTSL